MTRILAPFCLAAVLVITGCDRVKSPKVPFLKRDKPEQAAAASKPAESEPSVAAAAPPAPVPPMEAAASAPAPVQPVKPPVNTNASVMALCYHNIEDGRSMRSLTISVAEFEKQLIAIKEAGFTVIRMQDFLAWRRGEKSIPEKSCLITIDDGWVSGYTNAWPLLKKYGYPFTLFIYVNYVGTGGKSLTWEQLAELRDDPDKLADIQSHTYSHSNLRSPGSGVDARNKALILKDVKELGRDGWLRKEIIESKKVLEERLGIRVSALAYPFGIHTQEARDLVKEARYEAAFTVYGRRITHSSPFDLLGRYAIEASKPEIFENALKMIGGGDHEEAASSAAQAAVTSMITQPMEGETISDPKPVLKANLATFGDVEPGSVELRLSGIGLVPVKYDPATKMATAQVRQQLREQTYTAILSAQVKGRRVEARWSFNYQPAGAPARATKPSSPVPPPPPPPPVR